MQAVFRFKGDQEIGVSNRVNGVMVEIIEGVEPGYHGSTESSHRMTECTLKTCGWDAQKERVAKIVTFSKSEARSVASAIMGAAAEL